MRCRSCLQHQFFLKLAPRANSKRTIKQRRHRILTVPSRSCSCFAFGRIRQQQHCLVRAFLLVVCETRRPWQQLPGHAAVRLCYGVLFVRRTTAARAPRLSPRLCVSVCASSSSPFAHRRLWLRCVVSSPFSCDMQIFMRLRAPRPEKVGDHQASSKLWVA